MALYHHRKQTLREATERKRNEEALREGLEGFRRIFNHSNDMIFLIDPEKDEILDVNPTACWTIGYTREELMSLPVSTVHLNDMPKLQAFAQSVFKNGNGWTNELKCVTRSGQLLTTEISAFAFEIGDRGYMIDMVRDVTDLKRGEKDLRESNLRLEQRIRELTALNALFRKHLKERDQSEQRHLDLKSSARGFLNRLQELETELQPVVEDDPHAAPTEEVVGPA